MTTSNLVHIIFGRTLERNVVSGHGESYDLWREYPACGLAFTSCAVAAAYITANNKDPSSAPLRKAEEYAIIPFAIQE